MATQANFAATPRLSSALLNTANTDTTGTGGGSFPSIFTAGANGSRLDTVKIKAIVAEGATQAADSVRLWVQQGGTKFFLTEIIVPVGTGVVSTTLPNFETTVALGIQLPANAQLLGSTHQGGATGSYHGTGVGGDY